MTVFADRVLETTTTTGTGTVTLGGAVTGYRAFSAALADGDVVDYCIHLGSEWEVGSGTYSGGTLSRDTILASSNANAAVNFSAGTKRVFATLAGATLDGLLTKAEAAVLYGSAPAPTGTALISGGGVAWLGDYDYRVSAANYVIQGVALTSPEDDVTLAASHATLDRIDIIALNASGAVEVLQGTNSATPAAPDVDPTTHLALTFVYVAAASTEPTSDVENLYLENTEWTVTTSGTTWATASTNNPLAGTKCVEGTSLAAGAYVQFEKPSGTINADTFDSMVGYLRSKAAWANAKQLTVTLRNAGVQVGSPVVIKTGAFGFDSAIASAYQQLVIPTVLFAAGGLPFNQVRFTVAGGGGAIGFYLDNINLQSGAASAASVTDAMRFRGPYSATSYYVRNDVVLSGTGATMAAWLALQAGVGNTPAEGAFWTRLTPPGLPSGGTDGQIIQLVGGVPTWVDNSSGGGSGVTSKTVTASYTRPADTTTYAIGDVLANSTSAATILTFADVAAANGGGFTLEGVTMIDDNPQSVKPDLELFLFDQPITMQNDNVAWAPTDSDMEKLVAFIPLYGGQYRTTGAGNGILDVDIGKRRACHSSDTDIYGVVVARSAYAPGNAEKFTFRLHVTQDT